MKKSPKLKIQGFTLVELLVVVVIIGALAAVALTIVPRMMARAKSNQSMIEVVTPQEYVTRQLYLVPLEPPI